MATGRERRRSEPISGARTAALALLGATQESPLREAFAVFQDFGAAAAARITRQRMRSPGIRSIPGGPRTATRAHPRGLTRREHRVLDLICDGHTNPQIAPKLFISAKTVDHHVSAILTKLGAPTRRAAAAEARRLGLVGAAQRAGAAPGAERRPGTAGGRQLRAGRRTGAVTARGPNRAVRVPSADGGGRRAGGAGVADDADQPSTVQHRQEP